MSSAREIEIREKQTRCWMAAEPAVRAYVAAAVRSAADREDVLQQVALTVARRFEEFDEGRPFVNSMIGNEIRLKIDQWLDGDLPDEDEAALQTDA